MCDATKDDQRPIAGYKKVANGKIGGCNIAALKKNESDYCSGELLLHLMRLSNIQRIERPFALRILFLFAFVIFSAQAFSQLSANFTSNTTSGCSPLFVQFLDSSSGGPTEWSWDLGNGTVSSKQDPGTIYINPGTYTVKLKVKNISGQDSITKVNYITVYAQPTVDFSAKPLTGCTPLNVSFTDLSSAGSGNVQNWVWDFGDGNSDIVQNPNHTYTVPGTYSVSLFVTNNFGCQGSAIKTNYVVAADSVNAGFTYNYQNVCNPPAKINFTNTSSSSSVLTYKWTFGDGNVSTQKNPSNTYNTAGNFSVRLIASNSTGCSDTAITVIGIGTSQANFTTSSGACLNESVTFTDSSSPVPISGSWDFGDGNTATGLSATHAYSVSGTYTVTYIADFGGCTSTVKKNITVTAKPTPDFTSASVLASCNAPLTVQFTNASVNATSYTWDFGDGTTSTAVNPSHTYTTTGNFNVSLIAFSAGGCADTIVKANFVRISQPLITGFSGLPFLGCAPSDVPFSANISSPDPINTYSWSFGDGGTSTLANPTHTYTTQGSYTVTLTVTTLSGCSSTDSLVAAVVLSTKPTANFTANPTNACASQNVAFTDKSTGGVSTWYWIFGDGTFGYAKNPVHHYQDTGTFTVKLVVSNNGCKDSLTIPKYIHVNAPIAKFVMNQDCSDRYLRTFSDRSIAPLSWNWDFGDGTSSTAKSPSHTYASTGVYNITLTVTNGGCTDTATNITYVIDENPTFSIKALNTNFCKYDSIQFVATNYTPAYVTGFKWDFGDGTTTNYFVLKNDTITHGYLNAGTYLPILMISDLNGCYDTVTNATSISIYGPKADFTGTTSACSGQQVTFTDQSTSDGSHALTQWVWDYGDGNIDTLTGPPYQHSYIDSGEFDIKLRVLDSNGCYDTAFKPASVIIGKPYADFTTSDSIKCSANNITFKNNSAGRSLTYFWDFGDGTTSTRISPVHAYTNEGVYTVSLITTDQFGCVDTIVEPSVVTISNPVAKFDISDSSSTCPPLPVQVTNNSTSYSSLSWDFGDGNTSTLVQPFHLYTVPGVYTLQLVAQGYGQCFDTASRPINLKGPYGTIQYNPNNGCFPAKVSFNATAQNTTSYTWDFGDGATRVTKVDSTSYTYNSPGAYVPKLILEDKSGCRVPIEIPDTIHISGVKPRFEFAAFTGCDSSLVNFSDSSTYVSFDSAATILWRFGDGKTSSQASPSHYYNTPGTYIVTQTITSVAGCTGSYSFQVPVSINKAPKLILSSVDSTCFNSSVSFAVSDTVGIPEPITWNWDLGNGNSDVSQSFVYNYPLPGLYTVSVIGTGTLTGCADTVQKNVTVIALPQVDAGNDTTICVSTFATLNPSGASTYNWSPSGTLSCSTCTNPLAAPQITTTYNVIGADNFGCVAADSVTVTVIQPTQISLAVTGDTVCLGSSVQLNASGAQQYSWSPSSGLSNTTIGNPLASPGSTTVYTVIGSDNNNCFADTAQVTVFVAPIPTVDITDSAATINVGSSYNITTTNSTDVAFWTWQPPSGLSCADCANPVAAPKMKTTYTVNASNIFGCSATDAITIDVLCNNSNVFIPNTFSPNGDGKNDFFFPQGKGLLDIKSIRIFNRWGVLVFSKYNFAANSASEGWNGMYNNVAQPSDVYVYVVDIQCENGVVLSYKGNITLLR